jgi:hypothetical protein
VAERATVDGVEVAPAVAVGALTVTARATVDGVAVASGVPCERRRRRRLIGYEPP